MIHNYGKGVVSVFISYNKSTIIALLLSASGALPSLLSVREVLEIGFGLEGFDLPVLLSGAVERSTEKRKKKKKKRKCNNQSRNERGEALR